MKSKQEPISLATTSSHHQSPSSIYHPSFSDLNTESAASFFTDRNTSLGTLMGVSAFCPIIFSTPSHNRNAALLVNNPGKSKEINSFSRSSGDLVTARFFWWMGWGWRWGAIIRGLMVIRGFYLRTGGCCRQRSSVWW